MRVRTVWNGFAIAAMLALASCNGDGLSSGVTNPGSNTAPPEAIGSNPDTPRPVADSSTWVLDNSQLTTNDPGAITYVGNGYLSAQIGPLGQGYWSSTDANGWTTARFRRTSAFAADFPGSDGSLIADLPLWTGLTLATPAGWLDLNLPNLAGRVQNYDQQLDTQHGIVTTRFQVASDLQPITASSNLVSVEIKVIADKKDERHGMVVMNLTPGKDTSLSVVANLDITGVNNLHSAGNTQVISRRQSASTQTASVTVTNGSASDSSFRYAVVDQQLVSPGQLPAAAAFQWQTTNGTQITFNAKAGVTYQFVKHAAVGVAATENDAATLAATSLSAALATAPDTIIANHRFAWEHLWDSDIVTSGDQNLQKRIHSATYNLYASLRSDGTENVGPAGLGSLSYDGKIYWDADTWMLPSILVLNPDLGKTIVNYRIKAFPDAVASARNLSGTLVGTPAYYPWGDFGREPQVLNYSDWRIKSPEPHLMGAIAIALYDYYASTGDAAWLKTGYGTGYGGFDVIDGIGDWFKTVAVKNSEGQYTLQGVEGVDETALHVSDHAYTNALMWRTMQILQQLAPAAGKPTDPSWSTYQNVFMPVDPNVANVTAEYAGFSTTGTYRPIQIDTLLVQYPAAYPLPTGRALNDYQAYAAITRSNRPGFGDAGFSIIASKFGTCSMSSELQAATHPFMRGPFLNYWETRDLSQYPDANAFITHPALPFLTGAGAFLQTLTHGLTGYRFRTDRPRVRSSSAERGNVSWHACDSRPALAGTYR